MGVPAPHRGRTHRMVLACEEPDRARRFYRETTGARLADADFVTASGPLAAAPRWELVVAVRDLDGGRREARVSSPEGLTVRVRRLDP